MEKVKNFIYISLILFLTVLCPANSAAGNISAKITALEGDVSFKQNDNDPWSKAAAGLNLVEGAYVMTAFESACELEFVDKSKMKIKELSKIQINKFSSELKKVDTQITLYNGNVRATVHKDVDVKTDFRVKTPVSTISVRGTEKEITSLPGFGTTVHNISGLIEVTNLIGQKVVLAKGDDTKVSSDGKRPAGISEAVSEKARKSFMKNDSLTSEEEDARFMLTRPGFDMEAAQARDLFEISRERQIFPTSVIGISWSMLNNLK